jgi:hypothetical protein
VRINLQCIDLLLVLNFQILSVYQFHRSHAFIDYLNLICVSISVILCRTLSVSIFHELFSTIDLQWVTIVRPSCTCLHVCLVSFQSASQLRSCTDSVTLFISDLVHSFHYVFLVEAIHHSTESNLISTLQLSWPLL